MNSAGLTIDAGTTIRQTFLEREAIAHCTSCDSGTRSWYTSADTADPSDAQGNAQIAVAVACTDTNLCICNTAGVCCQPPTQAAVPDSVQFIPFCSGGVCKMNAFIQGTADTQLTCTDNSVFTLMTQYDDATMMFNPMNTAAYFDGDSVSCSGCMNIMDNMDMCIGPTLTGPAPMT
ncbi:hypothetical protein M3Y99_01480800 [Aphelenchoides fujianensis]|nr:hypothetical protein M3Y99_01480800 [Aphelenchoides fujianensis]